MQLTQASRVVLFQNQETDPQDTLRHEVEAFFHEKQILVETMALPSHAAPIPSRHIEKPDLVVVLGGDGTFLRAAKCFARVHVPLVAINTGHLGFLTRIEANRIGPGLAALFTDRTTLENRMMLEVRSQEMLALNDVVIKNANPSRLASINVYVDDVLLAAYDTDGVIVSTPTGSTAYNLSAGGPVIDPQAEVLVVTPICPHSLSVKPIVLPASRCLRLSSDSGNTSNLVCAVDGEDAFELKPGEAFEIYQSAHVLPLVAFKDEPDSFLAILKRKLGWGYNPRVMARANRLKEVTPSQD